MNTLALRVAARYQRAAMDEKKLEEILLKIRKGATASLTWKQLSEVLAVLDPGWGFKKIVGLVKLHGRSGNEDAPELMVSENKDEIEQKHRMYSPHAVTSLPSTPKAGILYALDLTPVQERQQGSGTEWYFEFKPWLGHEGWEVKTPAGEVFNGLPSRFSISGSAWHGWRPVKATKLPLYDAIEWLNKNTDWRDQVNKKLGVGEIEEAVPRTRENTGSCPVCFQNIKLRSGKIVLHGYQRPGHGQVVGNCFGMGYEPYERSDRGMKDYLKKELEPALKKVKELLRKLKSGKVDVLLVRSTWSEKTITPDDPDWERQLKKQIANAELREESLEVEVKVFEKLIQYWKERPLPKQGEPHIDWYYKGQKP